MNQSSAFETKMLRLRNELSALTEAVISAHTRAHDEADLDEEIVNVISFRKDIESSQAVSASH